MHVFLNYGFGFRLFNGGFPYSFEAGSPGVGTGTGHDGGVGDGDVVDSSLLTHPTNDDDRILTQDDGDDSHISVDSDVNMKVPGNDAGR